MTTSTMTGQTEPGAIVSNDTTDGGDIGRESAEALGGRVMAAAGDLARQESMFLELVGQFDACNAVQYWDGIQSTAHWVSWACSIAVSTAREHVRVARALRTMPATRATFAAGQLTYSKVREITRLVDRLDRPAPAAPSTTTDPAPAAEGTAGPEAAEDGFTANPCEESLINLARNSTASQLARSVTSFRALDGTSRRRRERQRVAWVVRDDGNMHVTMVLPPEIGAAVVNAIQAATTPPEDPQPGDEVPDDREPEDGERRRQSDEQARAAAHERSRVEALAEIAHHYLASQPEDRSGEDRNAVVLEMTIDAIESTAANADTPQDVPEGTSAAPEGTSAAPLPPVCRIRGSAAVDASTAERMLCDAPVTGMIINRYGEPMAVGRRHRLATRAQRRALMVRDGGCQYPGCLRRRRLQAHHRRSWLSGGATDLDNLILLCSWHHTCVHERHISIQRCADETCPIGWDFTRPDGTAIVPLVAGRDERHPWRPAVGPFGGTLTGDTLRRDRARNDQLVADYESRQSALAKQADVITERYAHIGHDRHPQARDVFPPGGGEGYNLANCVEVLFGVTITEEPTPADAA